MMKYILIPFITAIRVSFLTEIGSVIARPSLVKSFVGTKTISIPESLVERCSIVNDENNRELIDFLGYHKITLSQDDSVLATVFVCQESYDAQLSIEISQLQPFPEVPFLDICMNMINHMATRYIKESKLRVSDISCHGGSTLKTHELYLTDLSSFSCTQSDLKFSCRYDDSCLVGETIDMVSTKGATLAVLPRLFAHKYNLLHRGMGVLVFDQLGRVFVHKRASTKRIYPSMYDMFIGGVSTAGESTLTTLIRELNEEIGVNIITSIDMDSNLTSPYERRKRVDAIKRDQRKSKYESGRQLREDDNKVVGNANGINQLVEGELLHSPLLDPRDKVETSISNEYGYKGNRIAYLGQTLARTTFNQCLVDVYSVVIDDEQSKSVAFKDGEVQWGKFMSSEELQSLLANQAERDNFVPDGLQVWDALKVLLKSKPVEIQA